ncbi:MAG: Uncharacterized protein G01um101470_506, partial [Parcubacteria group bacterium Gr01-1014_70]
MLNLFYNPNTFKKTAFALGVFGVVLFAVFSPVFSQSAEAQFACRTTDNIGTTWDCGAGNTTNTPYPDNTCNNACIRVRCVPLPAGAACGDNISSTGRFTNKEGEVKDGYSWFLWLLIEIVKLINKMLVILAGLAARLLDSALLMALAGLGGIEAITIGWAIVRDVANMFFIFILLVIAIATILRYESYGAKQLLPKLIIAALLINFSLVVAFTVVDMSNLLAFAFIGEITPLSDSIAAIMQINKISNATPITEDPTDIDWQTVTGTNYPAGLVRIDQKFTADPSVTRATPVEQSPFSNQSIEFFWQATILILLLTLIFVFVALSAMLLIRSVALIIIFVLAPIGFVGTILPATRGYANQWWGKLFQWSFFLPASAFMIYLSITYGAQMSQLVNKGSPVINMGMLFNYFATTALLMGSLIVARQMGIAGAGAAIGMGLGLARRARGYAGRIGRGGLAAAYRPVQQGVAVASGTILESKAAQRLAQMPVARQMLRIPAAIAQQRKTVAKDESKRIANLSAKQQ